MNLAQRGTNGAGTGPGAGEGTVAVLEIGTTAIRMVVAEGKPDGSCHVLDSVHQEFSLGNYTLRGGYIEQDTTEACVKILRTFGRLLDEYGVRDPRRITAVATSAVREASNRDAFLDRIFVATGIRVTAIDAAEVHRYTYLAVLPLLASEPRLRQARTVVMEVGGGSTELLVFRRGKVRNAHTYRFGSYRLRTMLDEFEAPLGRMPQIMQSLVDRSVGQIRHEIESGAQVEMLMLGGDARLAAALLDPGWNRKGLTQVRVPALARFTSEILGMTVDEIVEKFHVSYPDAEILGPALLVYLRTAQALKIQNAFVGDATLRDGILAERQIRGAWTSDFRRQIIGSANELGNRFGVDRRHAARVAAMCSTLYGAMRAEHHLDARCQMLLHVAALLHEVGAYVSNRSHHKHSMYLIANSDIFGLTSSDLALTALVARYHRRSPPRPTHPEYAALDPQTRVAVSEMAAILRVADALDRGRGHPCKRSDVVVEDERIVITVPDAVDLTLETYGLHEKGDLFRQVFGKEIVLRSGGGGEPGVEFRR